MNEKVGQRERERERGGKKETERKETTSGT